MLVTFECSAYANITMFGDIARQLIRAMGHSGSIPGAIRAGDVPAALDKLRAEIDRIRQQESESGEPEEGGEAPVSLATRALPLIELLEAASRDEVPVMWTDK